MYKLSKELKIKTHRERSANPHLCISWCVYSYICMCYKGIRYNRLLGPSIDLLKQHRFNIQKQKKIPKQKILFISKIFKPNIWVKNTSLILPRCTAIGNLLHFSVALVFHLYNADQPSIYFISYSED